MAKQTGGYDSMGQPLGARKGAPDPASVAIVEASNRSNDEDDELEPLIDIEAPEVAAEAPAAPEKGQDSGGDDDAQDSLFGRLIKEAQDDPGKIEDLANLFASDKRTRDMFGLTAGKARPRGDYQRDYASEPALRVYGGVEVAHPAGFVPKPPGWLPMYQAEEGGTTDDPKRAERDAAGKPIKTEEYKLWLDHHQAGTKMDGRIRFDIAAEDTMPDDAGVAI